MRCVIDNLELESASLAEKLVRWQVEAARGAETEFALQQQLAVAEKRLQLARDQHYDEDEVYPDLLLRLRDSSLTNRHI